MNLLEVAEEEHQSTMVVGRIGGREGTRHRSEGGSFDVRSSLPEQRMGNDVAGEDDYARNGVWEESSPCGNP